MSSDSEMTPIDRQIDQWKDWVRGREINSESTLDQYAIWIRRFETFLDGKEPTEKDVRQFDSVLADEDFTDYPWANARGRSPPDSYSHASRKQAASALKQWVALQYDNEITTEPQNLVLGDKEPFDPPTLSMKEVEATIDEAGACGRPGCRAALQLSYDAILRGSELVAVKTEDIDLDRGQMFVRATKGSNQVHLGLSDKTVEFLEDHIDRYPNRTHVFHNSYGRKWKPNAWTKHFAKKHHRAGSHAFGRHSPIVHRLNHPEEFEDMDPNGDVFGQVYRRARHVNPSMTMQYARFVDADPPEWMDS